jgi:hypothetical protein
MVHDSGELSQCEGRPRVDSECSKRNYSESGQMSEMEGGSMVKSQYREQYTETKPKSLDTLLL